MRKKIIAGNWKMNKNADEALALAKEISIKCKAESLVNTEVMLFPAFPFIPIVSEQVKDSGVRVGAQNNSLHKSGAYTGEVSAEMIVSCGADSVLVGHSERRQYFAETNHVLAEKINRALEVGLQPIYCCGEVLEERDNGTFLSVVENQIAQALYHLSENEIKKTIIAYEPVWAIGTGRTASAEQAQEVHAHIRKVLADQYGKEIADTILILYGGSCNPTNAKALFSMPDIDGGLIGGASLKADDFYAIIQSI